MISNQLSDYRDWIDTLKSKIKSARIKVALSINSQLIELYWELGKELSEKSKSSTWGTGIMEKISIDLNHEFPEMKGFSRRNLYAIKQWFEFYHGEFEFVPQTVAQIPWGHNRLIISEYKLTQSIPEDIKTQLPSIEELENDLNVKINKYRPAEMRHAKKTTRMSLKKKRNPKLKKEETLDDKEFCSDENFAFIVGFTSGGAPFGITRVEMAEVEKVNDKSDNIDQ